MKDLWKIVIMVALTFLCVIAADAMELYQDQILIDHQRLYIEKEESLRNQVEFRYKACMEETVGDSECLEILKSSYELL